jgi:hypothetical protein
MKGPQAEIATPASCFAALRSRLRFAFDLWRKGAPAMPTGAVDAPRSQTRRTYETHGLLFRNICVALRRCSGQPFSAFPRQGAASLSDSAVPFSLDGHEQAGGSRASEMTLLVPLAHGPLLPELRT